ncbi:coiled-coil domain-containing protein 81 [Porphyrio hochstetteri]
MEGYYTVAVSLLQSSLFPTLLHLSTKEVVAIWDAVSAYILGQMKEDKGVLLTGLGTFAMVQEEFHMEEGVCVVRRPVFQIDMDALYLQEFSYPTVVIPGNARIKPLNYKWLSRATFLPRRVVEDCVRETILLYSTCLKNRQRLSFAFKDIGVLSCKDDVLCMRFYHDCVTGLESKASHIALMRTRLWTQGGVVSTGDTSARQMLAAPAQAFPRFRLVVNSRAPAKAFPTWHDKAAQKHRLSRGSVGCLDKLLQRRVTLSLPVLPNQVPGPAQQDMEKKASARLLPPCPGSSPRTKGAGRQEPSAALPSSEGCKRALKEVWQLSADWQQAKTRWQEQLEQAKAERAAWEAWSAGQDRRQSQALGTRGSWAPHPPAQPRRSELSELWRKDENPLPAEELTTAAQLERLQPDHISPRAAQVLQRLEPHRARRTTFRYVTEHHRWQLEQQKQLPCTRCWNRSRGEGAGAVAAAVADSKGAGRLLSCRDPPVTPK